jgi:hypothetical protein
MTHGSYSGAGAGPNPKLGSLQLLLTTVKQMCHFDF